MPAPSISAEGSGLERMLPGSTAAVIDVIVVALPKLTPPFPEGMTPTAVSDGLSTMTISFPFGSTSGWTPITPTLGVDESVQVRPPSRE